MPIMSPRRALGRKAPGKLPKITSDFALIDVKVGRKALAARMPVGSLSLPADERIPVLIEGYISHRHGADDGTSIEFGVDVERVSFPATINRSK